MTKRHLIWSIDSRGTYRRFSEDGLARVCAEILFIVCLHLWVGLMVSMCGTRIVPY
ncbi:uncharacterized protein EI90DRAFT_3066232 [Cantharellus anzutake]|uniref:uncharacterized protein n=1 Tax=Cantharellus anzutake TaxID=1750568 RepID=UPI0019062C40|nr:uncharacterized protein EI90DRAFT_3066232 [Cantharellus anzutake]KAF8327892.1 hypothetical protein EI90DRAFT_3066232 [Cantharellus anzutake]